MKIELEWVETFLKPFTVIYSVVLCSVAAIVEKHHGAINITHTKNTFTVDVAL